MICVGCGKTSKEKILSSIDALCPQLKSCSECSLKYNVRELRAESSRQLLYNKHGMFPPLAVACKMCGERKCLWNNDGTQNLMCQDCNNERVYHMKIAGVLG